MSFSFSFTLFLSSFFSFLPLWEVAFILFYFLAFVIFIQTYFSILLFKKKTKIDRLALIVPPVVKELMPVNFPKEWNIRNFNISTVIGSHYPLENKSELVLICYRRASSAPEREKGVATSQFLWMRLGKDLIEKGNNGLRITVAPNEFCWWAREISPSQRVWLNALALRETWWPLHWILKVKHWTCVPHLVKLKRLGCVVLHEVDVKEMHRHPVLRTMRFDRIVFNFPHAGHFPLLCERHTRLIELHKELLSAFFGSARGMLAEDGEVHVAHRDDHPYNCWELEKLANKAGMHLIEAVEFRKVDYKEVEKSEATRSSL